MYSTVYGMYVSGSNYFFPSHARRKREEEGCNERAAGDRVRDAMLGWVSAVVSMKGTHAVKGYSGNPTLRQGCPQGLFLFPEHGCLC